MAQKRQTRGRIVKAKPCPFGTVWSHPFTLQRWNLSGWQVVGRFRLREHAARAAKRRGLKLGDE